MFITVSGEKSVLFDNVVQNKTTRYGLQCISANLLPWIKADRSDDLDHVFDLILTSVPSL